MPHGAPSAGASGDGAPLRWRKTAMTLDMRTLRELAAEFEFWPATTDPEDIERHRRQSAGTEANLEAHLREYGPGGPKHRRWEHLKHR